MTCVARFVLAFLICAPVLESQDTTASAANRPDTASAVTATRGAKYSFDGAVKFKNERPAKGALIVVIPADSNPSPRQSTVTDEDGRFHLDSLRGIYRVRVDVDNAPSIVRKLVSDRNIVATLVVDENRIE